jgi:predicted  nucleic acid-binding Zn-ribbon protein
MNVTIEQQYADLEDKYHDILDSHHHLEWEYNKQRERITELEKELDQMRQKRDCMAAEKIVRGERIAALEDALSYVMRVEGVVLRLDTYDMLQELVRKDDSLSDKKGGEG